MAPELFDGSACPNEATDTHTLGMTCRAERRDRVLVGHCESRRRRQAARACPIRSLRLFAACGHQTPPLASCRKFCWSSTRNEADVVRKLSLRERHRQREKRRERLSSLKFECFLSRGDCVLTVLVCSSVTFVSD
jgi:hypothetical protein